MIIFTQSVSLLCPVQFFLVSQVFVYSCKFILIEIVSFYQPKKNELAGHEIVPNTGANATKFFTLATKS